MSDFDVDPWLRCIYEACGAVYATPAEAEACELGHAEAEDELVDEDIEDDDEDDEDDEDDDEW